MNSEELQQLLRKEEGLKLDFKRELHKIYHDDSAVRNQHWDELIKDILSLANGNVGVAHEPGYLIIGAGNKIGVDGNRELFDVADEKLDKLQLLNRVNSACSPRLADINIERISISGVGLLVITIPPSPHPHETTRQLQTPKTKRQVQTSTVYSEGTVFIRCSEGIGIATGIERQNLYADKQRAFADSTASGKHRTSFASVPFVLPQIDSSTFTGRDEELAQLEDLLVSHRERDRPRIAGVVGIGGVGKSALVCHFAQAHRNDFPDGIIGLRVDGKHVDDVAREFARLCGQPIDSDDERDASTLMQGVFSKRNALLILDNADSAEIKSLLPGGNTCALVVTTRDRQLLSMIDIPVESRLNLSPLSDLASLQLLEQILGKERVLAEYEAARRIVDSAANLPLALRIIGSLLEVQDWWSLSTYADSLQEEKSRLSKLTIRGDANWDVRSSWSLSLRSLHEEGKAFFASLSVCARDGFSVRAAMAAGGYDQEKTHELIGDLYRLSLLGRHPSRPNRFVFHPLIRLFADELSDEKSLRIDAAQRHAQLFVELVKSQKPHDADASAAIVDELDDILIAADYLRRNEIGDFEFIVKLSPLLLQHNRVQEGLELTEAFSLLAERAGNWDALAALRIKQARFLSARAQHSAAEETLQAVKQFMSWEPNDPQSFQLRAMWWWTMGDIRQRQRRLEDAAVAFEESYTLFNQSNDEHGLATALHSIGDVRRRQRQYPEAIEAFQSCQTIFERLEEWNGLARTLRSIGQMQMLPTAGRYEEAVETLRRSVAIYERVGSQYMQAKTLILLSVALKNVGQVEEAIDALKRARALLEQFDSKHNMARLLNMLGQLFKHERRFDEAIEALKSGTSIYETYDNRAQIETEIDSLDLLGSLLWSQKRFDEAVSVYERLIVIQKQKKDDNTEAGAAKALLKLGLLLQLQMRWGEAANVLAEACPIFEQLKDTANLAKAVSALGDVLHAKGDLEEAAEARRRGYDLYVELKNKNEQAVALNSLGTILRKLKRLGEASDIYRLRYSLQAGSDDIDGQAITLYNLGKSLQKLEKYEEATEALQQSLSFFEQLGNWRQIIKTLNRLGRVLMARGLYNEAVDLLQRSVSLGEQPESQKVLAKTLMRMSNELREQGLYDDAHEAEQRAQVIKEGSGYSFVVAQALSTIAAARKHQGDFKGASEALQRLYDIIAEDANQSSQAVVLYKLGDALQRQKRYMEATEVLRRSFELFTSTEDLRGQAMVLQTLGGIWQRQGCFNEAIEALQRGTEVEERTGNLQGQSMMQYNLGNVLQRLGRLDEALECFQRCVRLEERIGNKEEQAKELNLIGEILEKQYRFEEAADAFRSCSELYEESGKPYSQAVSLSKLGHTFERLERYDEAVDALRRSGYIFQQIGEDYPLSQSLNSLCLILQKMGRREEAAEVIERSYELTEKLNDQRKLAIVLNMMGNVRLRQKRFREASDAYERSYDLLAQIGDRIGQAMALNSLGNISQQLDRFDEAMLRWEASMKIGRELHDQRHMAIVHGSMGKAFLAYGKLEQGVDELSKAFEIDEALGNRAGIKAVVVPLIESLIALERRDIALNYCERSLHLLPMYTHLSRMRERLLSPVFAYGSIREMGLHRKGYLFGYVKPEDGGTDIYFDERYVHEASRPKIRVGAQVKIELSTSSSKPYAVSLELITDKK